MKALKKAHPHKKTAYFVDFGFDLEHFNKCQKISWQFRDEVKKMQSEVQQATNHAVSFIREIFHFSCHFITAT